MGAQIRLSWCLHDFLALAFLLDGTPLEYLVLIHTPKRMYKPTIPSCRHTSNTVHTPVPAHPRPIMTPASARPHSPSHPPHHRRPQQARQCAALPQTHVHVAEVTSHRVGCGVPSFQPRRPRELCSRRSTAAAAAGGPESRSRRAAAGRVPQADLCFHPPAAVPLCRRRSSSSSLHPSPADPGGWFCPTLAQTFVPRLPFWPSLPPSLPFHPAFLITRQRLHEAQLFAMYGCVCTRVCVSKPVRRARPWSVARAVSQMTRADASS